MIILKIILLQLFWFSVVFFGNSVSSYLPLFASFILVIVNYYVFAPKISLARYSFLIILFTLFGYLHDTSFIWLNIITKKSYHIGFLSLWIIFIAYYGDIFNKLKNIPTFFLSILGALGGSLAYWSAYKLGALSILPGRETTYVVVPFTLWAVFFPSSMWLFYKDKYWNYFLDKTILFSFDKSGFKRHENQFTEDLSKKRITTKISLITGGTSGIGEEVAMALSRLNSKVVVTGRNEKKGKSFEEKNFNSTFVSLDMVNWNDIHNFCKVCEKFDYIVLNAGSMPENLIVNESGVEFQCASQLLGHYYLISWLKKYGKLNSHARIVWVSSGGMYLKELDLKSLFNNSEYEKVATYANVKRAQVTLVEELSKEEEWAKFKILAMHPGWVGTLGLKESLPKFYSLMGNRLRSPAEGADTILWLLMTDEALYSGSFYFDRKKVSPYITKKYMPSKDQRLNLMKQVKSYLFDHKRSDT
ncbi:MAG: SDR family NAD(P)-dependent oxidoreductase [Bacteriovorax sp.]|nr:SDR family NAD(P)-dependent oxidoreductase [Bacteriovorax sp.]